MSCSCNWLALAVPLMDDDMVVVGVGLYSGCVHNGEPSIVVVAVPLTVESAATLNFSAVVQVAAQTKPPSCAVTVKFDVETIVPVQAIMGVTVGDGVVTGLSGGEVAAITGVSVGDATAIDVVCVGTLVADTKRLGPGLPLVHP